MDRRDFARLSGAGLIGWVIPAGSGRGNEAPPDGRISPFRPSFGLPQGRLAQELRVDRERLATRMLELAHFGANESGGIDRVAFSQADLEARAWVADLMRGAGLDVSVDAAGNLTGRREGTEPALPPLMLGSHIDSVPGGGNFDGQVGSMGALEVAWTLADAAHETRRPLEFVVFSNEEGGKTGSRALIGKVEPMELDLATASGHTIGEGLARLGGDPGRLSSVRRTPGSITAFLELHVEQGFVLDAAGEDIGVVEGIVGIMRWNVTVSGRTNHAGTTPMDRRSDAMVGAARFVDVVHRTTRTIPGTQVATVGRMEAEPGVPNVIPGRVTLSLEIRDLSMAKIEQVFERLRDEAEAVGRTSDTAFAFERFYVSEAAPTAPHIRDLIEARAQALGLRTRRMPSGAGHDAQSMALLGPVGMIFVPSVDGISHAPQEHTEPADVANGADVLLQALLALDER